MVSRVLLFAVFIVGMLCLQQGQSSKVWRKINYYPVCFESKGERPAIVRNYGNSELIGAIKLVYRYGTIRCASSYSYNSRWGCYNYPGLAKYPLNVIITDKNRHRIFPLDKYLHTGGFKAGLWYYLPLVDVKYSNELVFSNYMDQCYLPKYERLYIWYGEDLNNYYEGDNSGRVCVDVYVHIQ